ncbi:MAG: patatin-like phospholipase family protein [Alphaproteobacteria bacterium]
MANKDSNKENGKPVSQKKISIALQGGGAHGAFSWGVLDKLLEDGRFDIRGISGTSAGGMNAAATIMGLIKGGPEVARSTLKDYWKSMSELSKKISPLGGMSASDKKAKNFNLNHTFGYSVTSFLQEKFSPYNLNPSNKNPFNDFVRDFFDFKLIRAHTERRIFLCATHVKTGKVKVFNNEDISADVMMASACLPFLFQAVRVDDEYYWDGGFIANPGIFPLIENTDAQDVVLVQLTKTYCDKLPKTRHDIVNRFKEITYNGCLVREMRAIHFITKMIDDGVVVPGKLKRINMHVIKNEEAFKDFNLSSAMNTDWDFLQGLFEAGQKTATQWIKNNFEHIGKKTSLDEEMFADFV